MAYDAAAHGADEALAVDDLVEMTRFNLHAIREIGAVVRERTPPHLGGLGRNPRPGTG
jgi:hypothetical protein